jgi:hypothetical protein
MNDLLLDRWKLIRALQDAVARLELDRTDTRALGFPESREEQAGRALLEELCPTAPATGRPAPGPTRSTPSGAAA